MTPYVAVPPTPHGRVTAAGPGRPRHRSPRVAMIGAGQLARMTHQAAIGLGQSLRVLAETADDPAAQVSPDVVVGSYRDLADLRRAAAGAAVVTFDHEHVPAELLARLAAAGVPLAPRPAGLPHAQGKLGLRQPPGARG